MNDNLTQSVSIFDRPQHATRVFDMIEDFYIGDVLENWLDSFSKLQRYLLTNTMLIWVPSFNGVMRIQLIIENV